MYGALGRQNEDAINMAFHLFCPQSSKLFQIKIYCWWIFIYWWLCEVEPSPKSVRKRNKVIKLIQEQTWWNMLIWNPCSTFLRFGLINNPFLCVIKHSTCFIKCICIQIKLVKLNYFPNLCNRDLSVADIRDILIQFYSYTCSMCLVLEDNITHYKLWDNIKDENLDELQWPEQRPHNMHNTLWV